MDIFSDYNIDRSKWLYISLLSFIFEFYFFFGLEFLANLAALLNDLYNYYNVESLVFI